jgi:uncharacterized protein YecE (DUF72 family)
MELQGKRVAILVEDLYQDQEVWYPYLRLLEAGAEVLVVGTNKKDYKSKFGYYRLPGPAGHKSRYEDPALEKLAEIVKAAKHESSVWVFTNVDMFADAKRLKKLLKL